MCRRYVASSLQVHLVHSLLGIQFYLHKAYCKSAEYEHENWVLTLYFSIVFRACYDNVQYISVFKNWSY
jgi:hypothetical protein